MNLRKQFEKETGQKCNLLVDTGIHLESQPNYRYIKWLEQRNKEQVEVLKKSQILHHIVNSSRLRDMNIDDFLTEDEEIFDALLDLEQSMRKLHLW